MPRDTRTHTLVHSLRHESDSSPPPQSAGWVSPPSPAIYSTFFHPATVDEAHPAPPSMSSHFSPHNLTFIQERRSTLPPQHKRSFLPPSYSTRRFQRQRICCMESPGKPPQLQLTCPSIYFVPQFFTVCFHYWRIGLKPNSLGFLGKRLWLVQRERLFVGFNWRRPLVLLVFPTNGCQNCYKSS